VFLGGHVEICVDRGSGPRKVMEWKAGDISGVLPYSRMKGTPGSAVALQDTEALAVHERHFPELIRECYHVTAACVHAMIDRARVFRSTELHEDLQNEKIRSLGLLAAKLAHDLNNPASAVARSSAALGAQLGELDRAARDLGTAGLNAAQLAAVDALRLPAAEAPQPPLTPLEQSDREEAIADWLTDHGADGGAASVLARVPVSIPALDRLASLLDRATLAIAVRYVAAESDARALTNEIERASCRISDLVSAVKRYSYVDQATAVKPVDVGAGLRDTVTILGGKARAKSVALSLSVESKLPSVPGFGGELNQVWMNLIDNAIDAAPSQGHVTVTAAQENQSIVVRVVDDGPGIADDIRARIYDQFFTTKPRGEGTGLGLDIARRVVVRHQGDLDFTSAPGRTEFRITLPRTATASTPRETSA
jgi:signal transduction histidine kinase